MNLIFIGLLQIFFSGAQASTIEKCAIFCDQGKGGHDLDTQERDYFNNRSLPITQPKNETTLNCFKPILACIGQLSSCNSKKVEVLWEPNKESQMSLKNITATCEESRNLGKYLKVDLGLRVFYQSTGTFKIKDKTNQLYYYKAVIGE